MSQPKEQLNSNTDERRRIVDILPNNQEVCTGLAVAHAEFLPDLKGTITLGGPGKIIVFCPHGSFTYSNGEKTIAIDSSVPSVTVIPENSSLDVTPQGRTSLIILHEKAPLNKGPLQVDCQGNLRVIPAETDPNIGAIIIPQMTIDDRPFKPDMVNHMDVYLSQDPESPLVLGKHGHPRDEVFLVRIPDQEVVIFDFLNPDGGITSLEVGNNHLVVIPTRVLHAVYHKNGGTFTLNAFTTQFDTQKPDFVKWENYK